MAKFVVQKKGRPGPGPREIYTTTPGIAASQAASRFQVVLALNFGIN
jgi:hypothetical protein